VALAAHSTGGGMMFEPEPKMPAIKPWWLRFYVYWRLLLCGGSWIDPKTGERWEMYM
jgi:hypothetical protein